MSKAIAKLAYSHRVENVIDEIHIEVTGGSSHLERRNAAFDVLEEFTNNSEIPVTTGFYETEDKGAYVKFSFYSEIPTEENN